MTVTLNKGTYAMYSIGFQNFGQELPDGDIIKVGSTAIPAGRIEFVLTTQTDITWYKEIRIVRPGGQFGEFVSCVNDDHGPATLVLPTQSPDDLANVHLVFTKAKLLGVHTGVYDLDLTSLAGSLGRRFRFLWAKDG